MDTNPSPTPVTLIRGDGIGPECVESARRVIEAAGAPIRFVGFLEPGQKALISAGQFDTAAAPDTLELVHEGDLLSATPVTTVANVR